MNNKVKFLRGTSGEYAAAEKDSDTIYFTTDDGKLYIGDKKISGDGSVTIDDTLSDTSTNPVQNKVIKQAIDNKADKSLYGDTTINVGRKAGTTVGGYSTAEGLGTTASGEGSHAEGLATKATGRDSHAEGVGSIASGENSHAGGGYSQASGISSFSHGIGTFAYADGEVVFGKYNISRHGTLFSIGDGTADDARHNAFEITTDGGKLHDKDIATTDLIPTTLPANGGNADTVDNLHADDFVNATDFNNYQIPNNTDVPDWIYANGKRYQRYMTNSSNIGTTNIPNDSISWVWYWFDGINIIACEWETGKYYICDVINGAFSGWKDVYTSGYKPYVTGSTTTATKTVTTNHGFTPSAVFYWVPSQGSWFCGSATFDTTSFQISFPPSESIVVNYLIFR